MAEKWQQFRKLSAVVAASAFNPLNDAGFRVGKGDLRTRMEASLGEPLATEAEFAAGEAHHAVQDFEAACQRDSRLEISDLRITAFRVGVGWESSHFWQGKGIEGGQPQIANDRFNGVGFW